MTTTTPTSPSPNQAVVRARNLDSGWPLNARLPYVDATLTDLTPGDPLNLLTPDTNRVGVRSARVELTDKGLNQAIANALDASTGPLKQATVRFQTGNRVQLSGWVKQNGVPVQVGASYRIERQDARRVKLVPESLTAYGIPARPILGALKLDLGKLLALPPALGASVASDGTVTVDLARIPHLDATIAGVETGNGTLAVNLGAKPQAAIAAGRRRNSSAWAELTCRGDVKAGPGTLVDATVVCAADPGQDSLPMSDWQRHGRARIERGGAAIDPESLVQQMEQCDPLFKVSSISLDGTTYHVKGSYNAFVKLPTHFELTLARGDDGQLHVSPRNARVLGLRSLGAGIQDDFSQISFLKPDGQGGYIVDLEAAAGLDMPRVGSLANRQGRLLLGP